MTIILHSLYYNWTKEEVLRLDKIQIFSKYAIAQDKRSVISFREFLGIFIVFLLGRVVVFSIVAPFGLAYLAAYMTTKSKSPVKSVSISLLCILGLATSGGGLPIIKYLLAFVLFGLIYISITTLTDEKSKFPISAMAGIALFLSGIIYCAQTGFVIYDGLMLVLESALCIVSSRLMVFAIPIIHKPRTSSVAALEELAGLYLIAGVSILGLSNISVGNLSLGNAFAAALIMTIAFVGGISGGAAGGVGIGLIFGATNFPITQMVGVYSFCALAAGAMKRFKKAGVILGFFVANSILSLYLGGFESGVFSPLEFILAASMFALLPKSVILEIEGMTIKNTADKHSNALKYLTQKLTALAEAFSSLGNTFTNILVPPTPDNLADVTTLFDKTADKVCKRCGLKFMCWEKQFNSTYDSMLKLVPALKKGEVITVQHLHEPFISKCIKSDEFISELNRVYAKYKLDMQWQVKVAESRQITTQQFSGVSRLMENLADELGSDVEFDTHLEKRLIVALEHAGYKRCDATVIKNKFSRHEVSLRFRGCPDGENCEEKIAGIVSAVLKKDMLIREKECKNESLRCDIYLIEKEHFTVQAGASKKAKAGQSESGDNFNCLPIGGGKYVAVLSDGMGSGKQAAGQSNITVTMLEQLLGAGFDKQAAIKIINSALIVRSNSECFATIDAAILDLFSGETEFIKIGANASFIKKGRKVEQIKSSTLPVGILSEIDVETAGRYLEGGEYIIMLTDGVHCAADNWIVEFLSNLRETTPQIMSEEIIKESLRRKRGVIDDDMTVIVLKLVPAS
jgi:stage II sporulation protein E